MRLEGTSNSRQNAKTLRREMTPPEIALWLALRKNDDGLRFRKQHPAGDYVLDFYCAPARLAIEVDGEVHGRGDRPARDAVRDAWLATQGVTVLRYPARDVFFWAGRGGTPDHRDRSRAPGRHRQQIAARPLRHAARAPPLAGEDKYSNPPPPGGGVAEGDGGGGQRPASNTASARSTCRSFAALGFAARNASHAGPSVAHAAAFVPPARARHRLAPGRKL